MTIICLICGILNFGFTNADSVGWKPRTDEFLTLRLHVTDVGRTEVTGIIHGQRVYVPVIAFFNFLAVRADYDSVAEKVTGYYITRDTSYTLDAINHQAKIRDSVISLSIEDFYTTPKEFYLGVEFFQRLFGLNMRYNSHTFTLELRNPPRNLPVLTMRNRDRFRKRLLKAEDPKYVAKNLDGKLPMFGAGVLDWSLTSQQQKYVAARSSYTFKSGVQFLGGNLFTSGSGVFGQPLRRSRVRGRLTYALWDSPALRQINLGDFVPFGVLGEDVFGAEITNRPPQPRIVFSDEDFQTPVEAGQQVDVFSRGQIIETFRANQAGEYSSTVPLHYGSNDVAFHLYNRWGEEEVAQFRPFVQRTILRPDEFRYSLSAGKLRLLNDNFYANGTVQWGLNSQVTIGGTVESFESKQTDKTVFPAFFATSRLSSSLIFNAFVSPSLLSTSSLNLSLPSLAGGTLTVTQFPRYSILNTRNAVTEIVLSSLLPVYFKQNQSGYFVAGARQTDFISGRERAASGSFSLFFKGVQPLVELDAQWASSDGYRDSLELLRSSFGLLARMPLDVIVLAQAQYDHLDHGFVSVFYQASHAVTSRFFASIAYTRFYPGASNIFFQLSYNLPFMTAQANVRSVSSDYLYQERATGSIGWASQSGDFVFDRTPSRVGYGDIILNPFIDQNNNDHYDPGEQRVVLGRMRGFTDAGPIYFRDRSDGNLELSRSLAYENYRIYPDPTGLDNPIWVPKFTSFAVESFPNRIQRIDIPIVEGGIVRGLVTGVIKGKATSLEGVRITIESEDTVRYDGHFGPAFKKTMTTFSTGEYEFFPIPPGMYILTLDSQQLGDLGYRTEVPSRHIEIRSVSGGDIIEGINFELK